MVTPRFRRLSKQLPAWLLSDDQNSGEGEGGRVAFSLGLLLDCAAERMRQALTARMPSRAPSDALPMIADDRRMLRGIDETGAQFAVRLAAWRYPRTNKARGTGAELARQVWHYAKYAWSTHVWALCAEDITHELNEADTSVVSPAVTVAAQTPPSIGTIWGQLDSTHWARYWVVLDETNMTAQPDWGDGALWGGAVGTPGYTIGQTGATAEQVNALRSLVWSLGWGPGHALPQWVIVAINGVSWSAILTSWVDLGSAAEWAAFAHWSRPVDIGGGVYRQTRARQNTGEIPAGTAARFWSLDPTRNNVYAGDPVNFVTDAYLVDDSTYEGDPTSYPTSATLPGGYTATGDPTNALAWRAIQLCDDGDQA